MSNGTPTVPTLALPSEEPHVSHTLTYKAKVDPAPGTILGPGLDGRRWAVIGTVHTDEGSEVIVEPADAIYREAFARMVFGDAAAGEAFERMAGVKA